MKGLVSKFFYYFFAEERYGNQEKNAAFKKDCK